MRNAFVLSLALVLACGSASFAERVSEPAYSLMPMSTSGTVVRDVAFIDDFEAYTPGPLAGQGGWDGYGPNIEVVTAGITGQSALHTSDASGYSGFEMNSPEFTEDYGILAADVRISSVDTAYQFVTMGGVAGNGSQYFNTRVNFEDDGTITVGQLNDAGDAFEFVDTGATWAVDETFQFAIEVLNDGTLNAYKNGAQIFSGVELAYDLLGELHGIAQYRTWAGNAAGMDGSYMADNFTNVLVPEPASLLLLGLATLALRRR